MTPIGVGVLPDMELAFRYWSGSWNGGALDVRAAAGGAVDGVLCHVTQGGWAALDAKEGVSGHYYERRRRWVVQPGGNAVAAVVYEVCEGRRTGFVAPAPAYLAVCQEGFAAWGFDPGPLEAAARDTASGGLQHLFVYGTLLPGEANHGLLAGLVDDAAQEASAHGTLFDLGPYPALTLGGEAMVSGQVFRLRDPREAITVLDELEGALPGGAPGGLYRRTVLPVQVAGAPLRCWAYVMDQRPDGRLLQARAWRGRLPWP